MKASDKGSYVVPTVVLRGAGEVTCHWAAGEALPGGVLKTTLPDGTTNYVPVDCRPRTTDACVLVVHLEPTFPSDHIESCVLASAERGDLTRLSDDTPLPRRRSVILLFPYTGSTASLVLYDGTRFDLVEEELIRISIADVGTVCWFDFLSDPPMMLAPPQEFILRPASPDLLPASVQP